MRTTAELREGFLSFFESKGHARRPSASLIPRADDRSTLLVSAGMQPLMPFFLGLEEPPAPLLTTVQKIFRTPDIDEVGLNSRTLTFFEMLGNFSFGEYFKEGAIDFAWEFLFDELGLELDRIWVSVFAGDPGIGLERTARILQQVDSVYDTDGYQEIMRWLADASGVAYGESEQATKAHRVIADHGRGMTFLAADGVTPSNEGRGYVMRRGVRRAVEQAGRVGLEPPYLARLADVVIE